MADRSDTQTLIREHGQAVQMPGPAIPTKADPRVQQRVEALLFATPEPLTLMELCRLLGDEEAPRPEDEVVAAIEQLESWLTASASALAVQRIAGGFRLSTQPEHAELLRRLYSQQKNRGLSSAALETLSIVAYRQPCTRMEIEQIRGVACGNMLQTLIERRMVRICGRKKGVMGRPYLYSTTDDFLEVFGLPAIDDLPELEPTMLPPVEPPAQPLSPETPVEDGVDDEPFEDGEPRLEDDELSEDEEPAEE